MWVTVNGFWAGICLPYHIRAIGIRMIVDAVLVWRREPKFSWNWRVHWCGLDYREKNELHAQERLFDTWNLTIRRRHFLLFFGEFEFGKRFIPEFKQSNFFFFYRTDNALMLHSRRCFLTIGNWNEAATWAGYKYGWGAHRPQFERFSRTSSRGKNVRKNWIQNGLLLPARLARWLLARYRAHISKFQLEIF